MLTPADNYATLYTLFGADAGAVDVLRLAEDAERHIDNVNDYLVVSDFEDYADGEDYE